MIFQWASFCILPAWLLLFFSPNRPPYRRLATSPLIPVFLAIFYGALIFVEIGTQGTQGLAALANPTLPALRVLFSSDSALAAGWIHYLCFDLWIAQRLWLQLLDASVNRGVVAGVLAATLMLGPVGWLLAQAILTVKARKA